MAALKPAGVCGRALPAILAGLALSVAIASPAPAGDAGRGKEKAAATCSACHGLDGVSVNPDAPNLSGQIQAYLEAQMRAFRDGQRQNPMMTVVAKPLSDADISDLAAWYSGIQISVNAQD